MKIRINEDNKYIEQIKNSLKDNMKKYGKPFCPCVLSSLYDKENSDDYICLCREFREMESGECNCGLYIKSNDE